MLRLTTDGQSGSEMTLRVEGRIIGEWAAFLERECAALLQDGRSVHLDLSDVTYVDSNGAAVLNRLAPGRLTITNCPPLIRELLDQERV